MPLLVGICCLNVFFAEELKYRCGENAEKFVACPVLNNLLFGVFPTLTSTIKLSFI